jgi:hypothetical protein
MSPNMRLSEACKKACKYVLLIHQNYQDDFECERLQDLFADIFYDLDEPERVFVNHLSGDLFDLDPLETEIPSQDEEPPEDLKFLMRSGDYVRALEKLRHSPYFEHSRKTSWRIDLYSSLGLEGVSRAFYEEGLKSQ